MDNDLSRRSSRQPLVPADDTLSLTSFPDPAESASPSLQEINEPLVDDEALRLAPTTSEQQLNGLLDTDRPSMFDAQEQKPSDPQNLSAASTDILRKIIDHRGAVELVRHLSSLLAERDAHVTALSRLAEEYNVPREKIIETANRVRQSERRRLSLAGAASEDLAPSQASESSVSASMGENLPEMNGNATIRNITRLFGGGGKRKDSTKPSIASIGTASSSRSNSVQPPTVKKRAERPQSMDVLSIDSVNSGESSSWMPAIVSAAGGTIKGLSVGGNGHRARENREPVEMSTRHDEAQLPPTLSRPTLTQPKTAHEAEWNKFLAKLMRLREQTGEEATSGELLGSSRWGNEGASGRSKLESLIRLVVGGIPMPLRHAIWMELSNTQAIITPDAYRYYLNLKEAEDPREIEAILKDVPRTLTSKYDYYAEKGHDRLKKVLVAFVAKYPGLGYTQGLNMIAGYLLLAIPDEADAFWILCNMVDNFFPKDYFSRDSAMSAPLSDNVVLRQYVKELLPKLSDKLTALDIDAEHTVPLSWFLTAFASVLPETVLLRIWDVWLCLPNQKTFLFNIALTLLSQNQKALLDCSGPGEYFLVVTNKICVPEETGQVNELIRQAFLMRKKLEQVELRRAVEMKSLKRHGSMEAMYTPDAESGHTRSGSEG